MNILLLGKTGQVGQSILKNNNKHKILSFNRFEMPLDNQQKLSKNLFHILNKHKIDFLINAAAYTDVNAAEKNQSLAYEINANALLTISSELKKNLKINNTVLIHFSTDYVFNGSGYKPWYPNSETKPLNVYGKSKIKGEEIIRDSLIPAIVLRTSWVFSQNGNNFLKKIIKKLKNQESLKIVDDQIGSPTSSEFISQFCLHAIENKQLHNKLGTYHLTAKGTTSWFGFARYIADLALEKGIFNFNKSQKILPVKSSSFDTSVTRPLNSHLDCSSLEKNFKFPRTTWKQQTQDVLDMIVSKKGK